MAVFIAYLANFGIPRSGEVLRAAVLANYENVPFQKGFGTIVAERFADMIMMLIIIAIALFLEFDYIYQFFAEKFNQKTLLFAGLGLLLMGLLLLLFIKTSKSKVAIKIRGFVNGLLEGVFSIFKMKQKWAFIGHTIFIFVNRTCLLRYRKVKASPSTQLLAVVVAVARETFCRGTHPALAR